MDQNLHELLEAFIEFGEIGDRAIREAIAQQLKEWRVIPQYETTVPIPYQLYINYVVNNKELTDILKRAPKLKLEIVKKILEELFPIIEYEDEYHYLQRYVETLNPYWLKKSVKLKESTEHIISDKDEKTLLSRYYNVYLGGDGLPSPPSEELQQLLSNLADSDMDLRNLLVNLFAFTYRMKLTQLVGELKDLEEWMLSEVFHTKTLQEAFAEYLATEDTQETFHHFMALAEKADFDKPLHLLLALYWLYLLETPFYEQCNTVGVCHLKTLLGELFDKYQKAQWLWYQLGWDLSKGFWQEVDSVYLDELLALLEKTNLKKALRWLGRLRDAIAQVEYEQYKTWKKRYYAIEQPYGASEIVGVTQGGNINKATTAELSLLADKVAEYLFYKKLLDRDLYIWEQVSKETVETKEEEVKWRKRQSRGPVVVVADTSGSMAGYPEEFAKAFVFAMASMLSQEDRPLYIIFFSTQYKVLELTAENKNWNDFLEFLKHSFHGGTDPTQALTEAIRTMENNKIYQKADLFLLTDGQFGNLSDNIAVGIKELKEQFGCRFFALILGGSADQDLLPEFEIMEYDLRPANLVPFIEQLRERLKQ